MNMEYKRTVLDHCHEDGLASHGYASRDPETCTCSHRYEPTQSTGSITRPRPHGGVRHSFLRTRLSRREVIQSTSGPLASHTREPNFRYSFIRWDINRRADAHRYIHGDTFSHSLARYAPRCNRKNNGEPLGRWEESRQRA